MSQKSINFDDKNIKRSDFSKNNKLFKIDDIDANKILATKKEPYGTKKPIKNTLLSMMIMILLHHYVQSFLKRLNMLNVLIVIKQCLLRSAIKSC